MLSEFVAIPFANDDTLLSIVSMSEDNVSMPIMFVVTILLRASMLFELVAIPPVNDVTLLSIAVII